MPQTLSSFVKRTLLLTPAVIGMAVQAQRPTIVIDPARGGTEYGARIDSRTYEKQVTLDLANRLRSLLNARNLDVVLTRDSDTVVSNDQRATVANQAKPIACLLLHATGSGTGLHLFTSSLSPTAANTTAVLWDEAQAPFVQRSQRLATELATAFSRSRLAVSTGKTWIRPLDNMQCPAIAIEVAPESSHTNAADRDYQTRIADAIANSLLAWRNQADVMQSILAPAHEPSQQDAPKAPPSGAAGTPEKTPEKANAAPTAGSSASPSGSPVPRKPVTPRPSASPKPDAEGSTPQ